MQYEAKGAQIWRMGVCIHPSDKGSSGGSARRRGEGGGGRRKVDTIRNGALQGEKKIVRRPNLVLEKTSGDMQPGLAN